MSRLLRLLDSTVLIDYLRGRPAVQRVHGLRAVGDTPCTSVINVEEVVRGIRPGEAPSVGALVAGLVVLPAGEREGWQAGDWRREFALRGRTLWQADALVAATALTAGATLVTANPKDFPMPGIVVEHWPVGE